MFDLYRRMPTFVEIAEWSPEFDMTNVSISQADKDCGSPKSGDRIVRNCENRKDQWLLAEKYFFDNFEKVKFG